MGNVLIDQLTLIPKHLQADEFACEPLEGLGP